MKMTRKKDFDCIAFKRKAQARIFEQIKDMSPREEIDYFNRSVLEGPFGDWWERAKKISGSGLDSCRADGTPK